MSVTIEAGDGPVLIVAGDVEARMPLPYDDLEQRFLVAASDGTLLVGRYGHDGSWHFASAVEGAGLLRIERMGEEPRLVLDWRVEWLTIAPYAEGCTRTARAESLPLFPDLDAINAPIAAELALY